MHRFIQGWILVSVYGALLVYVWQLAESVSACEGAGCDLTWSGIALLPLLPGLIVSPFWAIMRLRAEISPLVLTHPLVATAMLVVTLWRMFG